MDNKQKKRLLVYDIKKEDVIDPYDGDLFTVFDKGSEKEKIFNELVQIKDEFSLRDVAIETAKRRKWTGLLKNWQPSQIYLMDCKIRDSEINLTRKYFYIFIVVAVASWFFGYEVCRNKAVDFVVPDMLCSNNNTIECIKTVEYFQRSMRKYLAPF